MTQSELLYREGDRQISIARSHTAAGHAIFKLDPKIPLRWDNGDACGPIDKDAQYKIRLRITRAVALQPKEESNFGRFFLAMMTT
jgi:hypothetical protein